MGHYTSRGRRTVSFVHILCLVHGGEWVRIENTELLYPNLKIGHDAAMNAVITGMEGQRVTVHQNLMSGPEPVELEDETVEDGDLGDVAEIEDQGLPRLEADCVVPDDEIVVVAPLDPSSLEDATSKQQMDAIIMPPPPLVPRQCHNFLLWWLRTMHPPYPCHQSLRHPHFGLDLCRNPASPGPTSSPCQPPVVDDAVEREALLRHLDLLRLKFKPFVIPPHRPHFRH